jgi:hypothetical protein
LSFILPGVGGVFVVVVYGGDGDGVVVVDGVGDVATGVAVVYP